MLSLTLGLTISKRYPNFSSALIGLVWTCMTNMFENRTQSVGVPLNGVILNFGSFAVVERAFFSSSSLLCVISSSASNFSCHICRSWSSFLARNSAACRSSSCCCSRLDSNCLCSNSSLISSCLFFRVFDSLSLSAIKGRVTCFDILFPLPDCSRRHAAVYF